MGTRDFLVELGAAFALADTELDLLTAAGVRTLDAAHSVLASALRDAVGPEARALHAAVESMAEKLSDGRRRELARFAGPGRSGGGSLPPSRRGGRALPEFAASLFGSGTQTGGIGNREPRNLLQQRRWRIEEQGSRNTCVAFAVASCLELLQAGNSDPLPRISQQFLYWHMRRIGAQADEPPGWRSGATKLAHARAALDQIGFCAWDMCPYSDVLQDGQVDGEPPDAPANQAARENRRAIPDACYFDYPHRLPRPPGQVARQIHDQLSMGHPVAIAMPQYVTDPVSRQTNWGTPTAWGSGRIDDPAADWTVGDRDGRTGESGHAVCVFGFEPDPGGSSGGWFIFRNSVGANWAMEAEPEEDPPPRVPGIGFGAVSANYVDRYCWEWLAPVA